MRSLLNDFEFAFCTTPGDVWGLWMVTTVIESKGLDVGDRVRVLHVSDKGDAYGYLLCRAKQPRWVSPCYDADKEARSLGLCEWVPLSHLWVLRVPRNMPPISKHSDMEPFLTHAYHLKPTSGWLSYVNGSGISASYKPPLSWQFFSSVGGDTGKTGGLHMTQNSDGSRRCQLSVEVGVCGDSLVNTLAGTKAGVLMYLPNMDIGINAKGGEDVCYDSTIALTFSALLIVYIEALSIVRREVYMNPYHPKGGIEYPGLEWDFHHTPFTKPWTVASQHKSPINLYQYAKERARAWIQAEMAASPVSWKSPPPGLNQMVVVANEPVAIRLKKRGVDQWIQTMLTDPRITPHTLCYHNVCGMFFPPVNGLYQLK